MTEPVVQRIRDPIFTKNVVAFLDRALGDGLHDPESVRELITEPDKGCVVGIFENPSEMAGWVPLWKLLGVGLAVILGPDDAPNLSRELEENGIEVIYPLGYLESVALLDEYKGQGLGKQMALERMNYLVEQGCSMIAAHSWLSGSVYSSKPVLEKVGFRELAILPNHWAGTHCPKCGDDCHCSAALMLYVTDDQATD